MKFFAPSKAGKLVGERIAIEFGEDLADCELKTFADGEISCEILESVRGEDCFIIQSIIGTNEGGINTHLMQTMFMIDALKRASANSINLVIPYLGYARQDRRNHKRQPISAKVVASMLSNSGIDRVFTMDLHCDQIEGFFEVPVDNLSFKNVIYESVGSYRESCDEDLVIVAPDMGSAHRVHGLAKSLGLPMAVADKRRENPNEVAQMTLIGDVTDKTVILIDDMIDTGGTLRKAAQMLKDEGAKKVHAYATHALFSGHALQTIFSDETPFDSVHVSSTCPMFPTKNPTYDRSDEEHTVLNETRNTITKTKASYYVHDIAPLFAEAIKNTWDHKSVSESIM